MFFSCYIFMVPCQTVSVSYPSWCRCLRLFGFSFTSVSPGSMVVIVCINMLKHKTHTLTTFFLVFSKHIITQIHHLWVVGLTNLTNQALSQGATLHDAPSNCRLGTGEAGSGWWCHHPVATTHSDIYLHIVPGGYIDPYSNILTHIDPFAYWYVHMGITYFHSIYWVWVDIYASNIDCFSNIQRGWLVEMSIRFVWVKMRKNQAVLVARSFPGPVTSVPGNAKKSMPKNGTCGDLTHISSLWTC